MRAVAHGWKPSRVKAPPVSVAKEFVEADKKSRGGLAAMSSVDSGSERQRPLNQLGWEEGGDVDYQVEPGVYEAPNVEEMGPALEQMFSDMEDIRKARQSADIDYTWDKTTSDPEVQTDMDDKLAEMSGPEQVDFVKPRLLSAMEKMKIIGESPTFKNYSIAQYMDQKHQVHLWRSLWTKALQQQAREAEGEEKGMRRGGRVIPLQPGTSGHIRRTALAEQGYTYDPNTNSMQEPETTIAAGAAETPTYDPYYGAGNYANAWNLGSMPWRNWENYQPDGEGGYTFEPPEDWYDPGGGGPGGPSEPPPRIIPTDPAAYVGASSDTSGRGSEYRKQLRKHQNRVAKILGSARGGHVNYYQEGGAVRPGHAEGPNPYNEADPLLRKSYARWEAKHHIDPAPPPPPAAAAPAEDVPWWKKLIGYEAGPTRTEEELEAIGEARGGRINYQTGGLAIAAPAGGVPPWIEPTGIDPGYMDEPQGYQFGGAARGYRGVPPQRTPMQPGGGRFSRRFQRRAPGGDGMMSRVGGAPQRGGLAAMMQQAQAQRSGLTPGGPGYTPGGPGTFNAVQERARAAMDAQRGAPGGGAQVIGDFGGTMGPDVITDYWGPPGGPQDPYRNPGPIAQRKPTPRLPPIGRLPPPSGGGIPPWKQPPGGRIAPPPGKDMGGSEPIQGGPRVPPNMQGYLQKMRMQNRPPSGPVGGGGNRVGMQDQQGAFARAMQRGTGRAPMSRRMAFGRAGPTQ